MREVHRTERKTYEKRLRARQELDRSMEPRENKWFRGERCRIAGVAVKRQVTDIGI